MASEKRTHQDASLICPHLLTVPGGAVVAASEPRTATVARSVSGSLNVLKTTQPPPRSSEKSKGTGFGTGFNSNRCARDQEDTLEVCGASPAAVSAPRGLAAGGGAGGVAGGMSQSWTGDLCAPVASDRPSGAKARAHTH